MTSIHSKSSMSFDDVMARSRELGFVRGIRRAMKLAKEEGDHAFAFKLGMLIMQADTFVLANTREDFGSTAAPSKPQCRAPLTQRLDQL